MEAAPPKGNFGGLIYLGRETRDKHVYFTETLVVSCAFFLKLTAKMVDSVKPNALFLRRS